MGEMGLSAHELVPQVRRDRRRGDGQVPPARRQSPSTTPSSGSPRTSRCATRSSTARATSARSTATSAAAMRYTEARLTGDRRRDARRHRQGDRRLRGQLRRHPEAAVGPAGQAPEPAHQRQLGHRRRHGDEHPAPPPRRDRRRDDRAHRRPGHHLGRPVQARHRPGLPDRRHDLPLREAAQRRSPASGRPSTRSARCTPTAAAGS